MKEINIATAQFQTRNGDKNYNLSRIEVLTAEAAAQGARMVSFHELCITSYTFLSRLSRDQIMDLAEEVPSGESVQELIRIAEKYQVALLAGLVEKEGDRLYNTYVCVTGEGFVAKYRKLHPFISQHLSAGNEYVVFDLFGCRCGILICYDNNVIENVRATTLLGAEIIFMPHVTGCTPSPMPGRGWVDRKFWDEREKDPGALRAEFEGPKGRGWLLHWLPARAYDNGIYAIFSNPIGPDDDQLKNGNSMILDPYGEILAECRSMGDEVVVAACTPDKLELAGGHRYKQARRPELYKDILGAGHDASLQVEWMKTGGEKRIS
ncbi:MAG: nitrilase family protein [Bacteroidales bacterium]|nr:nitrilase family protein [Bacteroidales bacterium]